jgi:acetoin utilization deacetylase AcuC-like enzyme
MIENPSVNRFDEEMIVITEEACLGYGTPGHPERPARISATVEKLRLEPHLNTSWRKPELAMDVSLLRAHTAAHLERLKIPRDFDPDTAFFPGIEERARASAGAALQAMHLARAGEIAFSLMRPPGHHATRRHAMGFCYLNSVAVAVLEAIALGAKKVAVFDFDVHHGNGTENILENNPNAVFYSIHQFPCYPGTGGANAGNNCFNFPVPPQTPREEYRRVFKAALDQLKQSSPDLIAVSAGFDAYARDPLAQETLEAEDYYWLGQELKRLELPAFSVLEGGYSDDLPDLITAYLKGVTGG